MVLVAVIAVICWLVVVAAVLILCRAAHRLDDEIGQEPEPRDDADVRWPFAV
jgi:hypothetical protein